jgi:hypothetical protein
MAGKDITKSSTANMVPAQLSPRAQLMQHLNRGLPINKDYNLPEFIYRADLIPDDFLSLEVTDQTAHLENAILELDYTEGYPTIDGLPFWSRTVCESPEAYRAFQHYLDMPRPQEGTQAAHAIRQLHTLSAITAVPLDRLLSWSCMYYWSTRAAAYDAFILASHTKMKEHRLLAVEAQHYEMSSKFVETVNALLLNRLASTDEDDAASIKELMEILKYATQLQRLSLGAQPFSVGVPKDSNQFGPNASLEVILRNLTKSNVGSDPSKTIDHKDMTQQLFKDGDSLEQAQELIIRMAEQNSPREIKKMSFDSSTASMDDAVG